MALFGGENVLVGLHVVSAHTRMLGDGSEVFVGEHLRWNRGRTAPSSGSGARRPSADPPDDGQISLFPLA
jgi:hypothetical protein